MSNISYSEKLQHPKWQKKRLEILNRDNFTCTKCGDTETQLQVHHLKYTGEPYDAPNENLITVCKYCHQVLEHAKEYDIIYSNIHYGDSYRIAISHLGLHYYKVHDGEPDIIRLSCNFKRNSEILKQLYKLSIKK